MAAELARVQEISKIFPGARALTDVSLDIAAGEIHGLVGENGAGKSTLINILSGVFPPTSGTVALFGNEVQLQHPAEAFRMGIGVVHQETVLVPDFTAEENIWLAREPGYMGFRKDRELNMKTRELIDEYDIRVPLAVPVKEMRVAEQKLVEVLRALSINAKILIFDEPTEAMSRTDTENLFRILKALREKGLGILYVSHRLEEVSSICDRITVLRNGVKIGTWAGADLSIQDLVTHITDREMEHQYPKETIPVGEDIVVETEKLTSPAAGFKDISFHVRSGEIVGFFGMVGSRRTELMKCLFGAMPFSEGTIKIDSKQRKFSHPRDAMDAGVYLCPEDRRGEGLVLDMSIAENCTIPFLETFTSFGMVSDKRADSSTKKISDELSIKTPSIKQRVAYLSGGNQQKVVISKWLIGPAGRVFIFDEPTKGIDVGAKVEVYKLMQKIAGENAGVIFVSSDLRELMGIADRMYVMKAGRIVSEFLRDDFKQDAILTAALSEENTGGESHEA